MKARILARMDNTTMGGMVVGYLSLVVLMAFFCVWMRMSTVHMTYRLMQFENQKGDELVLNRKLTLEILEMKSPKNIEKAAFKLGLQFPNKDQVILKVNH